MLAPTVVTVPVAGGVRSNMHTCLISTAVTTTSTTATVKTPFAIISKTTTTTTTPQSSISTQTKQVGVEDGAGIARTGVAEIAAATATTAKVLSTTTNQL